jgi:thioredoxin reductase
VASVAIVGAGPYGLSLASYLRRAGVDTRVFGVPMESWERHMPDGMLLRSHQVASHIADPDRALGIEVWARETGTDPGEPLAISEFISYGKWFADRVVPDVDRRRVQSLAPRNGGFEIGLDDGDELSVDRVVVATGIAPFAFRPGEFAALPSDLVSHAADHPSLAGFAGKSVLVVGAGQSALETAALLKDSGSDPHLVARVADLTWLPPHIQRGFKPWLASMVLPPTDIGGPRSGWFAAAPDIWRSLSDRKRDAVFRHCVLPRGADWLRPRLAEVPLEVRRQITAAEAADGRVRVGFDDGSERQFDHVILGTGYKIDVSRYGFLSDDAIERIETIDGGAPMLAGGLESSLPGLHFTGAAAAPSFGPIMRFVVGTWYASPAIASSISGRRQRPRFFAYRPRGPRIGRKRRRQPATGR